MNRSQASRFSTDIRAELSDRDFCQTLYLSIKDIGTRTFKDASFQYIDGWLFIWTQNESFYVKEKELGDFVCIDTLTMPVYNLTTNV